MDRPLAWLPTLALLALLALASLAWAAHHALAKSDDLMRRAEEIGLLAQRRDPYQDPDMTYPPSALAVFTPLVGPFLQHARLLRAMWLGLNLATLGVVCASLTRLWGKHWPVGLQAAFCLAVVASKPVRGGIGLGQFHLVPLALMLLSVLALKARRPTVAGLLVGLALAKPTMVLPYLGYLALRRHWRALFVAGLVQALAILGVSLWLGVAPHRLMAEWLANAHSQLHQGVVDLPSLLERAWPHAPLSATQVGLAVLLLAVAAMYAARRQTDLLLISFAAFTAALFTYHRHYDLVLLLPALAGAIEAARQAKGRWARLTQAMGLLLALALISPSNAAVTGAFEAHYDAIFTVMVYGYLGVLLVQLLWHPADRAGRMPDSHPGETLGRFPQVLERSTL